MNTAEKIYSASTSEDAGTARLAERLARRIEDDIASSPLPVGGVMGSLRGLCEHYAVGRAAMREAVALLERRGLGRLRPGPSGGFMVAQPDVGRIGLELANYFQLAGVTCEQVLDAREAVDPLLATVAATADRSDHGMRLDAPDEREGGLAWHVRVRSDLAAMSGDPVLPLFVQCLNELTMLFAGVESHDRDWLGQAKQQAEAINQAVANRDVAAAQQEADRLHRRLGDWLAARDAPLSPPTIEASRQDADRTLALLVARRLAAEILPSGNAGQRLGSEWDLCERFSVSRVTLRQAIRQLQDSGLVECRRGRGNGLIVRDLRGTGSIRLVLAFLISRQVDPQTAGTTLFQLNRFVPALAVSRASATERARLRELLDRAQSSDPIDRYDLLALVQYVSKLARSPIIDLFSRCLAAYEARFHPFLLERLPAHKQAEYFALLRMLLDRLPMGGDAQLGWAKAEASRVMLSMSSTRPI
ncbi:DNA-binding FadR family transcriptional regulator [Sphingobium sp. B7D2B]|uniref:FadR/GntR family transcriptional regulator n=1 Tax=Sphingobium sp. B7D2B TaxID=2940583 RepID=UPI0022251E60|nr:GntR family transcriptional regulator [Sphingobium sp. B7D2B]MCW2366328.1 DNA-binding FadR family transcriptional regulator [Sphingobium sp. B7D2B]